MIRKVLVTHRTFTCFATISTRLSHRMRQVQRRDQHLKANLAVTSEEFSYRPVRYQKEDFCCWKLSSLTRENVGSGMVIYDWYTNVLRSERESFSFANRKHRDIRNRRAFIGIASSRKRWSSSSPNFRHRRPCRRNLWIIKSRSKVTIRSAYINPAVLFFPNDVPQIISYQYKSHWII